MTRSRAADDFPMIRARMEELRRERSRPRAADDFAMIRARMEELRRERTQALAEARGGSVIHPSPRHRTASRRPSMKAGTISRARFLIQS